MLNPKEKRKKDREFSKFILDRDKRICRWCGAKNKKCDTSHIIPKEFLPLRWNENNAICLCTKCHKFGQHAWHKNPLVAIDWLRRELGNEHCDNLLGQYAKKWKNT